MSERVYDRLVGVDAEGNLPPVVAERLRGEPGESGPRGEDGVSIERVEREGSDRDARAVIHLTDETTHEVALPRGPQGVSVVSVQASPRPGYLRVGLSDGTSEEVPAQPRVEWTREAQARAQGYWEVVSEEEPESPTFELSDGTVLPVKWTQPVSKIVPVFPEAPAWNDYDGTVNVAPLVGVKWRVRDGQDLTPGQWVKVAPAQLPGEVTVEAVALPGFRLISRAEFTHSYPDPEQQTVFTSESFRRADQVLGPTATLDSDVSQGGTSVPVVYTSAVSDAGAQIIPSAIQFKDQALYWPPVSDGSRGGAYAEISGVPANWMIEFELVRYENVRHGQGLTFAVRGYGTGGRDSVSVELYALNGIEASNQVRGRVNGDMSVMKTGEHKPGKYKITKYRNTLTVQTPTGSGVLDLAGHDPELRAQGILGIHRNVNGNGDQQETAIRDLKLTRLGF